MTKISMKLLRRLKDKVWTEEQQELFYAAYSFFMPIFYMFLGCIGIILLAFFLAWIQPPREYKNDSENSTKTEDNSIAPHKHSLWV